jgi:hypothetical protein
LVKNEFEFDLHFFVRDNTILVFSWFVPMQMNSPPTSVSVHLTPAPIPTLVSTPTPAETVAQECGELYSDVKANLVLPPSSSPSSPSSHSPSPSPSANKPDPYTFWNKVIDIVDVLSILYFTAYMSIRVWALSALSFQQQKQRCHAFNLWALMVVLLVEEVYLTIKRYCVNYCQLTSRSTSVSLFTTSSLPPAIVSFSLFRFPIRYHWIEAVIIFAIFFWGCYELFGVHCVHELNGTALLALLQFFVYGMITACGIGIIQGCLLSCLK